MELDIALDLAVIVKNFKSFEALKNYTKSRIEFHQKAFEMSTNTNDMLKAQGAIKELRRILDLDKEVVQRVKEVK